MFVAGKQSEVMKATIFHFFVALIAILLYGIALELLKRREQQEAVVLDM